MSTKPRLLFVLTEDWAFLTHRLPMARAAREAGYAVHVACHVDKSRAAVEAEGFTVHPLDLHRGSRNPLLALHGVMQLARLYRRLRPRLVHHVAVQVVVLGAVAALAWPRGGYVHALTGLGSLFSTAARDPLKNLVLAVLRWLVNRRGHVVLVQNHDDERQLRDRRLTAPERLLLIPGSGVDTEGMQALPPPDGPLKAALVARMLYAKGVADAAEAGRLLKARGVPLDVVLVGAPDPRNRDSVDEAALRAWDAEGAVSWWGHRSDLEAVWRDCAIAVLPTRYREGVPKSLLEAAAYGRPLVATDMPGCRDLIVHEKTGLLVPPGDPKALADALARLVDDPALRDRLGAAARTTVEGTFSARAVGTAITALYRRVDLELYPQDTV